MYKIGPDPSSKGPPASTSFPRHEEARPFPLMTPSAYPSSTSSTEPRDVPRERTAIGNFGSHYSTEQSPPGAHPPGDGDIFNFPQNGGGGAVRLAHMTPISPTNEDVYSSEQFQRNSQPPLSVLSPHRSGVAFPYFLTGPGGPPFSTQESEKYRKLMLKKQKRKSKQEKNVLNVFNAEAVVGHIGNTDDLDSVLQSMGEKVEKKAKVKKSKEKNEKIKSEKRERVRKSVEKDTEDIEEEDKSEDDDDKPREEEIKTVNKARNKFVEDDLMAFKENFNLVGQEPGPLTRHRSRDCLADSVESLPTNTSSPNMSFTKVTSKKHRTKRSKEECGKSPPGPVVAPISRQWGYALRSREVGCEATGGKEQVTSQAEYAVNKVEQNTITSLEIPSLEEKDFPKLVQDDFPALPGGGAASDSAPSLPSAWSRAVVKSDYGGADKLIAKNSDIEEITDSSDISEDIAENEGYEKDYNACDFEAVVDSTVSNDSVGIDIEGTGSDIENVDEGSKEEKDDEEEEEVTVIKTDISIDSTTVPDDPSPEEGSASPKIDIIESAKIDNIELVTNEDEFHRRKADNSAPVVFFSENDEDWTSAEFTFGFDVNEDLVANSSNLARQDLTTQHPQQVWHAPASLASIDTMDGAILSFGGSMRMNDPVPVSGRTEHLPPLPFYPHQQFLNGVIPNFRAYGMSFGHQIALQGMLHQQYQEHELEVGEKVEDAAGEDRIISPESGISSASPLSWQPDSSPSLSAPGSYPHNRDTGRENFPPLPLASQVSQSLSNWQGHSVHSDSSESDSSSPAPGWATQVEIEEDKVENVDDATNVISDKTNDSGLSSEISNASLEKDLKERKPEKFNLGEIVNFISSSWSSVSQDSSVSVFSVSSHAHTDVRA